MKKTILTAILAAATVILPVATPSAEAQGWRDRDRGGNSWERERWSDRRYYGRDGRYRNAKRLGRNDHVWRGRDGRYYCKRDNGTTGLIVGAAAGALLGRSIDTSGDRALGTLLGGAGGALLGREIDRGGMKCR